jgi:diacylglycerol kinase (ATP)
MSGKPPPAGQLERIVRAGRYSMLGFKAAWRDEAAFRQELVLAALLVPAAFFVGRGPLEWAMLIVPVLGVLVAELLNSAIEAVVDLVSPIPHPLAGKAKDLGSAAVFVALAAVVVAWGLVIVQRWA